MGRLVLCAWLAPAIAVAAPELRQAPLASPRALPPESEANFILGGGDAGAWPDLVALRDAQGKLLCTGTLVAPAVVLTAGHCDRTDLADVLVGGAPLDHPERGEIIAVAARHTFPAAAEAEDAMVLVLAHAAVAAPRAIASGWDVANGARVTLVGYGATDASGTVFVPVPQQATTVIHDASCATSAGCNALAQPAGELGAGGMGIDTCVGDSGGPLYLGDALAGVTSRGYANETAVCGMGSLYARADRLVGWIEAVTGATVAHGAAPTADAIATTRGAPGMTVIAANDPHAMAHAFAVVAAPPGGSARVDGDGTLRVCSDVAGDRVVVVEVADAVDATRVVAVDIAVHVADGPAAPPCQLDDGGCCDGGSRGRAAPIVIAVLVGLALRRRRRC